MGEILGEKYTSPAQIMFEKLYKFEYNAQLGGKKTSTETHRKMLVDEIRKSIEFPEGYSPKTLAVALSHCNLTGSYNLHLLFDSLDKGFKVNMPDERERKLFVLKLIDALDNKNQQFDSDYLSEQFSRISSFPKGFSRLQCLQYAKASAMDGLAQIGPDREGDAIVRKSAYEKTAIILADFIASEKVIEAIASESEQTQNM